MAIQKFTIGRGVFKCQCCGRNTRQTAIGQCEDYCNECDELLMLQNAFFDGCYEIGNDPGQDKMKAQWIAKVEKLGGNVDAVKKMCAAIFPAGE